MDGVRVSGPIEVPFDSVSDGSNDEKRKKPEDDPATSEDCVSSTSKHISPPSGVTV